MAILAGKGLWAELTAYKKTAIPLGRLDKRADFGRRQVLTGAKLGIRTP
jgi:hypothetical protein